MTKAIEYLCESLIIPRWPAPAQVRAVSTTRQNGVSLPPYDALNLAGHVGDDPVSVAENRRRLVMALDLAHEPAWLKQVHGTAVVAAETVSAPVIADAAWTQEPARPCVVMTADCLPVLLCDRGGAVVAAAHGGWRGLGGGGVGGENGTGGGGGGEGGFWGGAGAFKKKKKKKKQITKQERRNERR